MSSNVEARKTRKGTVVSTDMDKTITVEIEREFEHPLYVKRIRRDSGFKVHDEHEEADPGDIVRIIETRPLSQSKRWRLQNILEKQEEQAIELQSETDEDDEESKSEQSTTVLDSDTETSSPSANSDEE